MRIILGEGSWIGTYFRLCDWGIIASHTQEILVSVIVRGEASMHQQITVDTNQKMASGNKLRSL